MAFLDHGGLIVATQDYHQYASASLVYSTNEGLTWKYFRFASRNVIIYGVIVDPLEVTADVWSVYLTLCVCIHFISVCLVLPE